jgi:hypothetical protein
LEADAFFFRKNQLIFVQILLENAKFRTIYLFIFFGRNGSAVKRREIINKPQKYTLLVIALQQNKYT